jgi:hypothetical protein
MGYNPLVRGDMWSLQSLIETLPQNIIMIEIGVYNGESTEQFLKSGKIIKTYCIDPFLNGYDDSDPTSSFDMFLARKNFYNLISKYNNIIHIEKKSDQSLNDVPDQVDFVYIDTVHTYQGLKKDILNYYKKIKIGGILAGHDYGHPTHPGVKVAVDELIENPITFPDFSWSKQLEDKRVKNFISMQGKL